MKSPNQYVFLCFSCKVEMDAGKIAKIPPCLDCGRPMVLIFRKGY